MTVKDFIDYNNPCFSCGSKVNFYLSVLNYKTSIISIVNASPEKKGIRFSLKIGYNDNLYFIINTLTNSFAANDLKSFITYSKDKDFTFESRCGKCNSEIASKPITFSFINNFIKPISLSSENLCIKSKGCVYRILTSFEDDKSRLSVTSKNGSSMDLNIKLFPLYKFKNKDTFIKKAQIYLTFS